MSKPATVLEIETNLAPQGSAVARARAAVEALRERGVVALVTGSLAEGRFREGSDIDLLVTECPRTLKYAIEGLVEDCLMGYPFDVIYLQEIPLSKRESFLGKARDVSDIS